MSPSRAAAQEARGERLALAGVGARSAGGPRRRAGARAAEDLAAVGLGCGSTISAISANVVSNASRSTKHRALLGRQALEQRRSIASETVSSFSTRCGASSSTSGSGSQEPT